MYALIGMLATVFFDSAKDAGGRQMPWQFLGQLFVGVTIAVVAAIATVWLAHRRFRADQCWLAKRDAYSDILKELHRMADKYRAIIHAPQEALTSGKSGPGGSDLLNAQACIRSARETFACVGFVLHRDAKPAFELAMDDVGRIEREVKASLGAIRQKRQVEGGTVPDATVREALTPFKTCRGIADDAIEALHAIAKKDLRIK